MNLFIRKAIRSPHLAEVIASYGSVCILLSYMCLFTFNMSIIRWLSWTFFGGVFYTFLEYVFHRWILHEALSKVHQNHHKKPRNLRIIATPIIPVQLYDFFVILLIMCITGRETAYAINCGISFGQCVMDIVHVLFHSTFRPWYLESARSYHSHHHFIQQEQAHGLTTGFWDLLFGTFPNSWYYYRKYPWLKWIQLPFPLATFIIVGFLSGDTSKTVLSNKEESVPSKEKYPSKAPHGTPRRGYLIATFCTAMLVVLGWEGLPL